MPSPPHETRLRVRYGETDQMGVVYHANYLAYMEEGRTQLMRALGCTYSELERAGWSLAVRKARLRFRAAAVYDDELLVLTAVDHVGGASVTFSYRIERASDRRLLAEGATEMACVRSVGAQRKPSLLPEDLRARLESALGEV